MNDIERDEIETRLAIARDFKRATCGTKEVDGYVFGDPIESDSGRADKRGKHLRTPELNIKQRAGRCRGEKSRRRGITGVGPAGHYRPMRYRALMPDLSEPVFKCAIEAVEVHNQAFLEAHPEYPEFQCDPAAAWRKWGCTCGKHRRTK